MAVHFDSLFVRDVIGRTPKAVNQLRDKWKGQNKIFQNLNYYLPRK